MLKRILVLLGESASSVAARDYAFRLAKASGAGLSGLAGVDLNALHTPSLGRSGAATLERKLEADLRREAGEMEHRVHDAYEAACTREGVDFEWLSFEGDSLVALNTAAETRDLLVTGYDTAFEGRVSSPLSDMLSCLLVRTPRPVVVCGEAEPAGDLVVVGYDGSLPAMRALQMFVMLGAWQGRPVRVVSIDAKSEEAERRAAGAGTYLRSHGYEVDEVPVASRLDPTEVLRLEATNNKAGTLVMGSYGHRGLHEMLFGSSTSKLVENPPCALFVYH